MKKARILTGLITAVVFMVAVMFPAYAESSSEDIPIEYVQQITDVYQIQEMFPNLKYVSFDISWDEYIGWHFVDVAYGGHIMAFDASGKRIPEDQWETRRVEGGQFMMLMHFGSSKDTIRNVTLYGYQWVGSMDPNVHPTLQPKPTPVPTPTPFPTPGPQGSMRPILTPSPMPTPEPMQPSTSAIPRPTGTFDKYTVLEGPDVVHEGDEIRIKVNCLESGATEGHIEVSGLEYKCTTGANVGFSLSDEEYVFAYDGVPVTYVYQVSAPVGEQIFMQIVDAEGSDRYGNVFAIPVQAWTQIVQAKETPRPSSTATPKPSPTVKPTQTPERPRPSAALVPNSHLNVFTDEIQMQQLSGLTLKDAPNTCTELLQHFQCPSDCTISIQDIDGNLISDMNSRPATGYSVELVYKDPPYSHDVVIVVVEGDVLGTGRASIAQLVRLANAVAGKEPLVWPYKYAVNNGNPPTIADLVKMAQSLK